MSDYKITDAKIKEEEQEEEIESEEQNPFYIEIVKMNQKLQALIDFQKATRPAPSFQLNNEHIENIKEIHRVQHLEFLRKKELATLLQCKKSLIDKWMHQGAIPHMKYRGLVIFKREEIDSFLEDNRAV